MSDAVENIERGFRLESAQQLAPLGEMMFRRGVVLAPDAGKPAFEMGQAFYKPARVGNVLAAHPRTLGIDRLHVDGKRINLVWIVEHENREILAVRCELFWF